ncbi:hypothetical protein Glove_309g33 [Diversispora epigaea]|uniref:Uncharacterized protein n=1 Tax=Diversispora epigaea TaxID=1348612 RepID=A0A397HTB9_9GLOM|nr:hypothetical protein Glove_309g33 [Diversispora epigaea]
MRQGDLKMLYWIGELVQRIRRDLGKYFEVHNGCEDIDTDKGSNKESGEIRRHRKLKIHDKILKFYGNSKQDHSQELLEITKKNGQFSDSAKYLRSLEKFKDAAIMLNENLNNEEIHYANFYNDSCRVDKLVDTMNNAMKADQEGRNSSDIAYEICKLFQEVTKQLVLFVENSKRAKIVMPEAFGYLISLIYLMNRIDYDYKITDLFNQPKQQTLHQESGITKISYHSIEEFRSSLQKITINTPNDQISFQPAELGDGSEQNFVPIFVDYDRDSDRNDDDDEEKK